MKSIEQIESDMDIMRTRIEVCKRIQTEYSAYMSQFLPLGLEAPSDVPPRLLWSCWLQGIDSAPALVRSCHRELSRRFPDFEHVTLTQENLSRYVTLDNVIMDKWRAGIISNTAFSNLIRLHLLEHYGGIWFDATVLCTSDTLPDYVTASPFFTFSSWKWITGDVRPLSTWFMASCKYHPLVMAVNRGLTQYWHTHDSLYNYFIFHFFFRTAITICPQLWENVPRVSNVPPHLMQFELGETYSPERFSQLCAMSPVHKLTYRLPESVLNSSNTIYSHIIGGR